MAVRVPAAVLRQLRRAEVRALPGVARSAQHVHGSAGSDVLGELVPVGVHLATEVGVVRQVALGELLERVWDSSPEWQDDATVTEHVRRLRRKIEGDPEQPRWVRTVRGVGCRLEP